MKGLASHFSTWTLFETSAAYIDVSLLGKKTKTNEDLPMGERWIMGRSRNVTRVMLELLWRKSHSWDTCYKMEFRNIHVRGGMPSLDHRLSDELVPVAKTCYHHDKLATIPCDYLPFYRNPFISSSRWWKGFASRKKIQETFSVCYCHSGHD